MVLRVLTPKKPPHQKLIRGSIYITSVTITTISGAFHRSKKQQPEIVIPKSSLTVNTFALIPQPLTPEHPNPGSRNKNSNSLLPNQGSEDPTKKARKGSENQKNPTS